nr:hypothetical protein [Cohnella kolymensis]
MNSDGRQWYQSYVLDQIQTKKRPGITASIVPDANITTTDLSKIADGTIWKWKLSGEINDDEYVTDTLERTLNYTRFDIEKWEFEVTYTYPGGSETQILTSRNNGDLTLKDKKKNASKNPDLALKLDKSKLKAGDTLKIILTARTYYYNNSQADEDTTQKTYIFNGEAPEEDSTPSNTPPPEPGGPPPLTCQPNIPGDAFDIVPFGASDGTDLSRIADRSVTVDGVAIDADEFWSGKYVFGDDIQGLHIVSVKWTPKPGEDENGAVMCDTWRVINVHDTKPRAQFKFYGGSFKENRKMSVDNTSSAPDANDPLVIATYPIISADWNWSAIEGSDSDRRMKADGADHKEFLYKKPGEYQLTLTVTNALGRTSDPYVLPFSALEDYKPAIIMHPYSSQISRNESLTLFYDAVSTDGDIIRNQHFDVYYDADDDESYSELLESFDGPLSQYKPSQSKLGKYRIVATVDEDFGQETFPEFITSADKRVSQTQFEFELDNYIPYADLYTDIPSIRQQVDAAMLLDKNLSQSKIDYVRGNGVEINNQLRYEGIDPNLNVWDMHTYTYSQAASTVVNTGSYPPGTYDYCSNGYCGTLNRQSTSDNGSYRDFGGNQTVVDVPGHTATREIPWCYGSAGPGRPVYSHAPPCSLGSNSTTKTETYWVDTTYKEVWVSDIRWVSNWYATYTGTIYKNVRQPYSNPYVRTVADKYLIYISDNIINELPDFNKVKGLSDGKIILVGSEAIKTQTTHDHFIANIGQPIEEIIARIVDYIASNNPPTASQTVLIGESFNMLTDETDPESDPIVLPQTMYVHNDSYYDNSLGRAAYAVEKYDAGSWTTETLRTSFSLPGEYQVYRRVKDEPSTDPALAHYSYWSNEAKTIIRAHRKPIALAALDWTYDLSCTCYNTSWVDESYDLDHNISDPISRGIKERKISYRVGGEWYYQIPDKLAPGTYHLEYVVQDIEGAWSDPFVLDFTLAASPPPQLKAKLKSTDGSFTLAGGVPAGESVTAYELWTRFPYSLDMQFTMGGYINKTSHYFTGTKNGSDILWDDVVTQIPTVAPDGSYTYRISANGSGGVAAGKDFTVKVLTPINLVPGITNSDGQTTDTIILGYPFRFTAATTEYPSQVTLVAFKGMPFQKALSLTGSVSSTAGIGSKQWNVLYTPTGSIPDGTYTFEWTARTPNGNVEVKTVQVKFIRNTPPFGDFTAYTYDPDNTTMPVYEGDTLHIRSTGVGDNERDALTIRYEIVDPAGTKRHDQTFNSSYPYTAVGPAFAIPSGASAIGTWTIRQTISDGKAAPVIKTKTLLVRALGVQGYVRHTDAWEANRLRYNDRHPKAPRPADWFWAGEAFVLEASVTGTGNSGTKPVAVKAAAASALQKSLSASPALPAIWKGLLKEGDTSISFEKLAEGTYTFVFTVTYSNGVTKTSAVPIRIQDTTDHYFQVHRLQ